MSSEKGNSSLEGFHFSRFIFSAECKTTISLPPYSGSTLRGGFGRATDYLPYFIYALDELGRIGIGKGRGKYELRQVLEENPLKDKTPISQEQGNRRVIYCGDDKMLRQPESPIRWSDILTSLSPSVEMRFSFITPTRIKYKNSLTKDLEFHVLFRNLLRRISLLSYFHCGHRLDDQGFKDLIERARHIKIVKRALYWHDWERYSNRQETRMKLEGFMGEITYEGDFGPFWPYIRLGEYVHVGKGSSFGLGRYRVV